MELIFILICLFLAGAFIIRGSLATVSVRYREQNSRTKISGILEFLMGAGILFVAWWFFSYGNGY